MPSRSPADATRFTATGPHATQFSRSSSAAATGAAGAGETPQQRIARLRESARRAKAENITLMDKLYVHGRVWADRAHRAVAFGLIGATILCGGVTLFTLTDMILYNRRLKKQYAEEAKRVQQLEASERQQVEKMALIAAGGGPAAEALTPEERERGRGLVANFKSWALAGLTPASEEYKSRYHKDGGEEVVIDGPQTKWLPTKEGRTAENCTQVPEPGKAEQRMQEKAGGERQGRSLFSGVTSWFGR
ncbi:cytochrome oxidase c assembly-domain-containing protein [Kalaharituber pfeilii]|nr:cytochrome oxidase c assembly-domain-containing protein [Kalaharituber pfeilii]